MKGWVLPAAHLRVIDARWFNFSHKTSNRSRQWTFSIGHWKMRLYILIKAAATIRNFTVMSLSPENDNSRLLFYLLLIFTFFYDVFLYHDVAWSIKYIIKKFTKRRFSNFHSSEIFSEIFIYLAVFKTFTEILKYFITYRANMLLSIWYILFSLLLRKKATVSNCRCWRPASRAWRGTVQRCHWLLWQSVSATPALSYNINCNISTLFGLFQYYILKLIS